MCLIILLFEGSLERKLQIFTFGFFLLDEFVCSFYA